jgi:hypothetical protein
MNTPYKNKEIFQICIRWRLYSVRLRKGGSTTTNAVLSLIGLIESFLLLDQLKFELPVETQVFFFILHLNSNCIDSINRKP